MEEDSHVQRRGSRSRKLSLKALESAIVSPRKRQITYVEISSDEELCPTEKPQVLNQNESVPGDKLFTFQNRKKCEAILPPKTPHADRNKFKKKLQAQILEENSSASDFSDSGSEYVLSESESTSQSSEEEPEIVQHKNFKLRETKTKKINSYTFKTDDYFSQHASKKILTSNHTLDKLETPRLPQDQLSKLLSQFQLTKEHCGAYENLLKNTQNDFNKWLLLMNEGLNILLYGLGSKKDTLNYFHKHYLKNHPSIVVNGFFPSLAIKEILDGIILHLLELKENPTNVSEACDLIEKEFTFLPDTHFYIIVHNIELIRSGKAQSVFSRLASINNVHLLASIDHINAPLIWDHSKLSKFNFTWWDVTSFHSYVEETSFESSMMVQRTGTLALASLRNVFLSLTSNSKGIYMILVKYQIENGKKQYYQGLAFKDLYSLCREAFLVSSDLALRAQLTEFLDHKMVKFKRSPDGTEFLLIPIPNTVLQQFLNEQ